ncbi:MAG TPA: hypothetical protein VMD78_13615 [Candidatus Baltobacteraceae bacterium]|nr:hypothetical protein [Candidatus Baltobacteraceae bacterium]
MRKAIPTFMLWLAVSWTIWAQQPLPAGSHNLQGILSRMENGDLHAQKLAFDDLMTYIASEEPDRPQDSDRSDFLNDFFAQHPDEADKIKLALIHLLSREDYFFIESKNPPPDPHVEDDIEEHYPELIHAVASLDDERAIPALVGAMTTGGIATRGLLKYGDKALGPVLDQLTSTDPLVRGSALDIGVAILKTKKDSASSSRIRALVESSLKDSDSSVRMRAVMVIDCLDERQDFAPALQQLSKSDPDRFPERENDGADGDSYYPVRVQARRVLRDIQSNRICTP